MTGRPIKSVAILGLGTMGPGMAAALARAGCTVTGTDVNPAAIERAGTMLPMAQGVLDALGKPPAKGTVNFVPTLKDAVGGADLVIENVPEDPAIKKALYNEVEPLVADDALIVSDTSGIPITGLQEGMAKPGRMAGMHWSNPPHIIPMIEVIPGQHTAPETTKAVQDFITAIGYLPVLVKRDVPGFVENRILYAIMREALDLVDEGVVEPDALDTCVSWGIGYKLAVVGPMALLDMAGLDIYKSVASFLNQELSDRKDVAPIIAAHTEAGKLGLKTGEGLRAYTQDEIKALTAKRAKALVAVRKALEESR
ncbi:MAG: 3-hydroxyacyl-CoA dehydrogenase NAD-binding domain-containing protein [Pseudomonadota bacterium]